jgi:hypothetical protein
VSAGGPGRANSRRAARAASTVGWGDLPGGWGGGDVGTKDSKIDLAPQNQSAPV